MPTRQPTELRAPAEGGAVRRDLSWWLVVAVLAVAGGVVPALIANHFGALDLPRGDDAAYLWAVDRFMDVGDITGGNWAVMNFVGLLVAAASVAAVFGDRVTALHLAVATTGVLGLCALYDLGRRLVSSRRVSFIALLVAVGPVWLGLSVTFYTDVPAFAFTMASLALGARALRHDGVRGWMLGASMLIGFLGFTIREHAIVAPVAVVVVSLWVTRSRTDRRSILVGFVVLVLSCAALFVWRQGLDGFGPQAMRPPDAHFATRAATQLVRAVIVSGMLLSPAVLLAGPVRIVRGARARARRMTAAIVTAAAAVIAVDLAVAGTKFISPDVLVTNQWTLDPSVHPLVHGSVVPVLLLVGSAAALVLLCAAVAPVVDATAALRARRLPRPKSPARAVVGLAACGLVGIQVAFTTSGWLFPPRYLLPLVPLLAILVLSSRATTESPRRGATTRATSATVALILLAGLGLAATAANASFEATAWRVAAQAAAQIGDPDLVDGGFAWNAYRHGASVEPGPSAAHGTCVVVDQGGTAPDAHESGARVWTVGTEEWIVARRVGECPDRS